MCRVGLRAASVPWTLQHSPQTFPALRGCAVWLGAKPTSPPLMQPSISRSCSATDSCFTAVNPALKTVHPRRPGAQYAARAASPWCCTHSLAWNSSSNGCEEFSPQLGSLCPGCCTHSLPLRSFFAVNASALLLVLLNHSLPWGSERTGCEVPTATTSQCIHGPAAVTATRAGSLCTAGAHRRAPGLKTPVRACSRYMPTTCPYRSETGISC